MAVFYSYFSRFSKLESNCCRERRTSLEGRTALLVYLGYSGMIFSEMGSSFCFLELVGAGVFSSFLSSLSFLLTLMRSSGLPLRKLGWEKIFFVGSFLDLWKPYILSWDKRESYLSDEAVDISVSEVMWKNDGFEEISVLNDELFARGQPLDNGGIFFVLNKWRKLRWWSRSSSGRNWPLWVRCCLRSLFFLIEYMISNFKL